MAVDKETSDTGILQLRKTECHGGYHFAIPQCGKMGKTS